MSPKDADGVANSVVSDPGLHSLPKLMGDLTPTHREERRKSRGRARTSLSGLNKSKPIPNN